MTIDAADGSWDGTFTGIRHGDLDDVAVRAFLFGTGSFEGLCATLDIAASDMAGPSTWIVDGVVHPVPMAGSLAAAPPARVRHHRHRGPAARSALGVSRSADAGGHAPDG
jgi:hypothetical protein